MLGTLTSNTAFGYALGSYSVANAGDSFLHPESYLVLTVLSTKEQPTLRAETLTSKPK